MHSHDSIEGKNKMLIVVLVGWNYGDLVFFSDSPDVLCSVFTTSIKDSLSWFMILPLGVACS